LRDNKSHFDFLFNIIDMAVRMLYIIKEMYYCKLILKYSNSHPYNLKFG
jgi:hypothetical protein